MFGRERLAQLRVPDHAANHSLAHWTAERSEGRVGLYGNVYAEHNVSGIVSPLSFTVPKAEVLRYQLPVRLHRAVVVLGDASTSVGAEKGVMVHAGSPQVLAGLWAGQRKRNLTVLGLPLQ